MAISYQHPKVKVHVGDGFKFLDDYKNEFDVIITDSSDPEGPAESLFQKPYFQLLFGALKEGGVITTQGCTFSCVVGLSYLEFREESSSRSIRSSIIRQASWNQMSSLRQCRSVVLDCYHLTLLNTWECIIKAQARCQKFHYLYFTTLPSAHTANIVLQPKTSGSTYR